MLLKNVDKYTTIPTEALTWFAQHKRPLPWRENRTPYRIWLAEIMLQQTTVATVEGYYTRFLVKFPTVQSLATAPLEDVLHLWQGLGYYSRAKNLHKCAQVICNTHNGQFPTTEAELRTLPGIGPYTAASVASIAFGRHAPVVDANIERVISRLFEIHTPLPQSKPKIYAHMQKLTPKKQSGDYAEAMMDLGATICSVKKPKCNLCPLQKVCIAHKKGIAETLPKKLKKMPRPTKKGVAYCITTKEKIYLQKRPQKGLLANLWEVPHINWEGNKMPSFVTPNLLEEAPLIGTIKHVFTHFTLELEVRHIELREGFSGPNWFLFKDLEKYPTSTLMKKVLACII